MEYAIRKMNEQDIKKVQEVAKTSWNFTYEGIIPRNIQENFLNFAYNDTMMLRRLNNSLMLVAETGGEIIGFANFTPLEKDGAAELSAIYLTPEYHSKGIGTRLLNEGISSLFQVKELFINVERDNKIGTTFYRAKGFEFVSEFGDDFDGHILKTVRMVLKL